MIRGKLYLFGANQNRNRLNLSVTHWFQRKLTSINPPHGQTAKKTIGGPDHFPALPTSLETRAQVIPQEKALSCEYRERPGCRNRGKK